MICVAMMIATMSFTSCNKDSDSEAYENPISLAVTSFTLTADLSNPGLDSVYFSIDLNHGVIFNADSLRKGTKINKLLPKIGYDSNVDKAIITMTGGSTREGELEYKSSNTDSIDFTGNVTLKLIAADGAIETTYRLKVNVHEQDADLLAWDEVALRNLPSRLGNPVAQKTISFGSRIVTLLQEKDYTYTIAYSDKETVTDWTKIAVTFPFTPDIKTFTGSESNLWLLSDSGELYTSPDMESWISSGETWSMMIGNYIDTAVGLRTENGKTVFAQYPQQDINPAKVPSDFPISGVSNFVTLSNIWTSSPVAFFFGGVTMDGKLSDSTWAFDGKEWIKLSTGGAPALDGAAIIPYYNFRPSASGDSMIEHKVWMLMGGRMADGNFNRTVYISYDNGVNWSKGGTKLQLPDVIPAMVNFDNLVIDSSKSANLSDAWKVKMKSSRPMRINYSTDGDIITWECPYIYIVGGYDPQGKLYDTIWRGVLTRLTFTPII